MDIFALIAVFAPLVAFVVTGLFGRLIGDRGAQILTCSALIIAAACSVKLFFGVIVGQAPFTAVLSDWVSSGAFQVSWSLRVDQLTVVMMNVITIVSACVHVYSVGYMSHDKAIARFMGYLSLFTFAMLMLVTADNLLQLFFGWEGVGLASYLLIGFWHHKESANKAAMKAFVVNRVGDFGLMLGMLTIFVVFGAIDFNTIFSQVADKADVHFQFFGYDLHAMTLIGLFLFIGAVGKSAQLGLHTWLPDAMEGPTPVSALIHAATMVTAGVFLIARFSPLYEFAPIALMVVCVVGALTAFVAATIGMTQFDIKRVIAYSTMSQLGYMFFALGVSAYGAAMFHLVTHAFFKALLFLGAGSVIHAMSDEQDMRKMGGIWKKIPMTYAMMWIGSLALAGIPFFAGYYSKDMILESAWADHTWFGTFAYWSGIAAALMTAFYSWRLIIMTFHGAPRADHHTMEHVHESPAVMIVPLIVLAVGAIFSGKLLYNGFVGSSHHHSSIQVAHDATSDALSQTGFEWSKDKFWGDSLKVLPQNDTVAAAHDVPQWVALMPLWVALCGIALAYALYLFSQGGPLKITAMFKSVYKLFYNKWFFDELYEQVFVRTSKKLGMFFWQTGDKAVIDGCGPDGVASLSSCVAKVISKGQTGYLFHYAFVMMTAVIAIIMWFSFRGGWVG